MKWWLRRQLLPLLHPRLLEPWRTGRQRRRIAAGLRPPSGPQARPRLYVDVSVICRQDAGTGIQRLVRAVSRHLLSAPASRWEVIPVAATRKRPYHRIAWPEDGGADDAATPMAGRAGDVFLGLDFALETIVAHREQLVAFKQGGGTLWFLMYDLLPLQQPGWFSDALVVRYRRWLRTLAVLADGFFCISEPVESELRAELSSVHGLGDEVRTRVLPMGSDFSVRRPRAAPACDDTLAALRAMAQRRSALMVGTLEPRKGHADVLGAFDLLWSRGLACNLVIAGQAGWKTEPLQRRIQDHPEHGIRLFWLADAGDDTLEALYAACTGVIAASYGEGFGLPVIEALRHAKPVLARDLPVFRMHEAAGVRYFPEAPTHGQLADVIGNWIAHPPTPDQVPVLASWTDTARALLEELARCDAPRALRSPEAVAGCANPVPHRR